MTKKEIYGIMVAMNDAQAAYKSLYQQQKYQQMVEEFVDLPTAIKQDMQVRNFRAAALYQLGQLEEAKECLTALVKEFPACAEAHRNLALIAVDWQDYTSALKHYQLAVQANGKDANAYHEMAEIYFSRGDVAKAGEALAHCLQCQPSHLRGQLLQLILYLDVLPPGRWKDIRNMVQNPEKLPLFFQGGHAHRQMLISWLTGDSDKIIGKWHQKLTDIAAVMEEKMLSGSAPNMDKTNKAMQAMKVYAVFFRYLLAAQPAPPAHDAALPALYMVGDSHTLPYHHQTVKWGGTLHQVHTQIAVGIKLWHLASAAPTMNRSSLIARIKSQPKDAPVLLCAGEIDTRLTEGILPYSQKRDVPYQKVLETTFDPAILFFRKLTEGRNAGICGIPAPCKETLLKQQYAEKDWAGYAGFVKEANARLKALAEVHDLTFVDVHALTAGRDQLDNGQWSLDGRHLTPTALGAALAG